MRETLIWNRWWMCFYSNKEAHRKNPGEENIIENHISNPYVGMFNAHGCSISACPVVIDITAIAGRCYRYCIIWSNITALEQVLIYVFCGYIMLGNQIVR